MTLLLHQLDLQEQFGLLFVGGESRELEQHVHAKESRNRETWVVRLILQSISPVKSKSRLGEDYDCLAEQHRGQVGSSRKQNRTDAYHIEVEDC